MLAWPARYGRRADTKQSRGRHDGGAGSRQRLCAEAECQRAAVTRTREPERTPAHRNDSDRRAGADAGPGRQGRQPASFSGPNLNRPAPRHRLSGNPHHEPDPSPLEMSSKPSVLCPQNHHPVCYKQSFSDGPLPCHRARHALPN